MTAFCFTNQCVDGEHDWMDSTLPKQLLDKGELPSGSQILTVPKAGHQLFLENWEAFNDMLWEQLNPKS